MKTTEVYPFLNCGQALLIFTRRSNGSLVFYRTPVVKRYDAPATDSYCRHMVCSFNKKDYVLFFSSEFFEKLQSNHFSEHP